MTVWQHPVAWALRVGVVMATLICGTALAASVTDEQWSAYQDAFVQPNGRVVDTANGQISHSEGQGYGMLLAVLADKQTDFDRIWSFTRTELMLRDDGLVMWRWDPNAKPHVTDPNNATDGDILIAYALGLAGEQWKRTDLTAAARELASAIGSKLVVQQQGMPVLLPGNAGYDAAARPDGPVVNLSYWIFEAFPVLAELAPETDWQAVSASGIALLEKTMTPYRDLPPEWLSIAARVRSAKGFKDEFGYNAVRIPLYMIRGDIQSPELLERMRKAMTAPDGNVVLKDLTSDSVTETLNDVGYRIIPALADCVLHGTRLPEEFMNFQPTLYYPSSLHLLALSSAVSRYPECLP
ncbi:endoglucanase [Aureimonas fodinaquatilis]|uniref:Glucanase n=1 Tax=Aureimonas fodinaquatilis TaxID=2565783 RepID=A0A5B0DPV7_9HYPH|nr:glycosyl hydrolase family 8 [Aureimonas fodinaquatilis]KAA0968443.1 endoglucanase [Aureimonas fodinaquatilis]